MPPFLLALDFGGTKLSAAVLDSDLLDEAYHPVKNRALDWKELRREYSPPEADAQYDINTMLALAKELLGSQQAAAVGVSFGGPVDAETGTVRLSHHVSGWDNTPLRSLLEQEFKAPVFVDNDANVAALGEHRFGAGQGFESLLYITVSTGVGGGWILNNRPWRGAGSMAGEIGHTVVDPYGPLCLCGKHGCVERLASGPYMAQEARERLQAQPERGRILRKLVENDLEKITARHLSQAAGEGDELAWEVLERGAWALGNGIGTAANLINAQLFVLGGGVTKAGKRYWQAIRTYARQTALPQITFKIEPAELGDDAPLWGAIALAHALARNLPI
ncbi:MAG: ROK family protein [Anaerolineales bacterium]|jgi:glucokinase